MNLQPDAATVGGWINRDWNGQQPGTFAVVIGVSRYTFLDGSANSYELGQLHVSALTAYRFFCWLRDRYTHSAKPLARVWLLLSPTAKETAAHPALAGAGAPPATLDNCRKAIGQWYTTMKALNSVHAEKSRAVFFFSGHGLEVMPERQLLLPEDYLELGSVNHAMSSYNLYAGLRSLPLTEHAFFFDACRNDHQKLREAALDGTPILNVWPSYQTPQDLKAPIVYATGPGSAAWEPGDPALGPSVFGQALLEGLTAVGLQPRCAQNQCWVSVRTLEDFLEPRISELLLAAGSRVKQPVRISGPSIDICEVAAPAPAAAPAAAPPPPPPPNVMRGLSLTRAAGPVADVPLPPGWDGARAFGGMHSVVQNEFLTQLLTQARVTALGGGATWRAFDDALAIRRIARNPGRRVYRIDVELRHPGTVWLELPDPAADVMAACVLLDDEMVRPRYTLEVDFSDRGDVITDFDVVLSEENPDTLGEAAKLWNQFRVNDVEKTLTSPEARLLERALQDKMRSPLAATVGSLLLLRAWRHDLLHDWARNLAKFFPDRPDGCVVWAEQLLRTERKPDNALEWLLGLDKRGVPHTIEGLGLAGRQVHELLQFAFPRQNLTPAQKASQETLERLDRKLRAATALCRPGGFALTFLGSKAKVTPALL